MSDVLALKDLVLRLEMVAGPDRELDADIWKTANEWHGDFRGRSGVVLPSVPYLTESIDDAMMLVPEGFVGGIYLNGTAFLQRHNGAEAAYSGPENPRPNMAIALCIAALKVHINRSLS